MLDCFINFFLVGEILTRERIAKKKKTLNTQKLTKPLQFIATPWHVLLYYISIEFGAIFVGEGKDLLKLPRNQISMQLLHAPDNQIISEDFQKLIKIDLKQLFFFFFGPFCMKISVVTRKVTLSSSGTLESVVTHSI